MVNAHVFPQITGHLGPEIPGWLSFTIFSIMSFFLALLGFVLQADVPQMEETALSQA